MNFLYIGCSSLRNSEGISVYAVSRLCMDRQGQVPPDDSCLLGGESGACLVVSVGPEPPPYLPQAPNRTPALSCASTVTPCKLFPDQLFGLLHKLLPPPFGGGLAGRFGAVMGTQQGIIKMHDSIKCFSERMTRINNLDPQHVIHGIEFDSINTSALCKIRGKS